jgi:hypothetical protein
MFLVAILEEKAERPISSKPFRLRRSAPRRLEKNFRISAKVADKRLIGHDSLPRMEGNGSKFLSPLSSKARPGRADDTFWKLRGGMRTWPLGGVPWECLSRRSVSREMAPQGLENTHFAPGDGMAPAVLDPQQLVSWRAATARRQSGAPPR